MGFVSDIAGACTKDIAATKSEVESNSTADASRGSSVLIVSAGQVKSAAGSAHLRDNRSLAGQVLV